MLFAFHSALMSLEKSCTHLFSVAPTSTTNTTTTAIDKYKRWEQKGCDTRSVFKNCWFEFIFPSPLKPVATPRLKAQIALVFNHSGLKELVDKKDAFPKGINVKMKHDEPRPGFEHGSSNPFPKTITSKPWAFIKIQMI